MDTNEGKMTFMIEQKHNFSAVYSAIYSSMYLYCERTWTKVLVSNKCYDTMLYIEYNDIQFVLDSTGGIPFIEE